MEQVTDPFNPLSAFSSLASGLGSSAGPSMATASGQAFGSSVTVGGLTVNKKPDLLVIAGAALLGAAIVWLAKA
ncbi:MAG: hypothetical protein COA83_09890 [Methylophaga sp.]|nr:MAG: hypothetical protein COA83_09890 [Methylophaga sp.]